MKTKSMKIEYLGPEVTFDEFRMAYKEATKMMLTKIVEEGAYETDDVEQARAKVLLEEYWEWKKQG